MRDPQRHVLVLDVNVYLEVASLVGPPFEWSKFDRLAAQTRSKPVPCADQPEVDSLRLIAMCTSGKFAGEEPLEVWSCTHIDSLVVSKAQHPLAPAPGSRHRGLGWSPADGTALAVDLVEELGRRSNGGTLGTYTGADNVPPLDHEDGMVYGACRYLAGDDPLARIYCVTRDGGFLTAYRNGELEDHTKVVSPPAMLEALRRARAAMSIKAMPVPNIPPPAPSG